MIPVPRTKGTGSFHCTVFQKKNKTYKDDKNNRLYTELIKKSLALCRCRVTHTEMKSIISLVLLTLINRALGATFNLQLCHSHCNIGEVDCILRCPHIFCEQECTRAEEQCIRLCDTTITTTLTQGWTTQPHSHIKSTTDAPTTKETLAPSTSTSNSVTTQMLTPGDLKPTPKPHHPPTTTLATLEPTDIYETTTDQGESGVVIIG